MNNCNTCKYAMQTNVYFEDINGELCPFNNIFVAYCEKLDDYVVEDDYCRGYEHFEIR